MLTGVILETNRKCPRWAEFNSGAAPVVAGPAGSPPPPTTNTPNLGFNTPFAPSPLATSTSAQDVEEPAASKPKIKFTIKNRS